MILIYKGLIIYNIEEKMPGRNQKYETKEEAYEALKKRCIEWEREKMKNDPVFYQKKLERNKKNYHLRVQKIKEDKQRLQELQNKMDEMLNISKETSS